MLRKSLLLLVATAALLVVFMSPAAAQSDTYEQFRQLEIKSGGTLGVWALHVETGQHIGFRENEFFPMASVYKVPIGIYYLNQVFLGRHKLTDTIRVTKDLLAPEHSLLTRRWKSDGDFTITHGALLEQMVSLSDNTACDILLGLVGGTENVMRYFSSAGLRGFSINRTEKQMGKDYLLASSSKFKAYNGIEIDSVLETLSREDEQLIVRRYLNNRRDVSTPEGMGQLLLRLHRRTLPGFTDYPRMLRLMEDTPFGQNRIKAGLPGGSRIAHKTGGHRTLAGVNIATNDAGIATLPDGSHIIIVVFLKGSTCGHEVAERVIAETTSAVIKAIGG